MVWQALPCRARARARALTICHHARRERGYVSNRMVWRDISLRVWQG